MKDAKKKMQLEYTIEEIEANLQRGRVALEEAKRREEEAKKLKEDELQTQAMMVAFMNEARDPDLYETGLILDEGAKEVLDAIKKYNFCRDIRKKVEQEMEGLQKRMDEELKKLDRPKTGDEMAEEIEASEDEKDPAKGTFQD